MGSELLFNGHLGLAECPTSVHYGQMKMRCPAASRAPTLNQHLPVRRRRFLLLTDAAFGMIPLIEAGTRAEWPF